MSVKILAIETSCDDTAAAVIYDGIEIKSNIVSSQEGIHQKFGGVVPEVASRKHLETIDKIINKALEVAGINLKEIDAIGVTNGPGLVGALLVGLMTAKSLAYALNVPLIAVNHMEGHIYANFLCCPGISFPLICLVVSGGHSDLVLMEAHGNYRLIGKTRDDAAGEAFDKVARLLGLGYPGGPQIERMAREGNEEAVPLPQVYLEEGSFDFSFSGVKTAVMYSMQRAEQLGKFISKADYAASFQRAVCKVLVDKTIKAAIKYGLRTVLLAGGVAANGVLKELMAGETDKRGIGLYCPPAVLCTDNAAMIGCAAYYKYLRGDFAPLTTNAVPGLSLS